MRHQQQLWRHWLLQEMLSVRCMGLFAELRGVPGRGCVCHEVQHLRLHNLLITSLTLSDVQNLLDHDGAGFQQPSSAVISTKLRLEGWQDVTFMISVLRRKAHVMC